MAADRETSRCIFRAYETRLTWEQEARGTRRKRQQALF